MVTITETAKQQLREYFKENEMSPIRVYLTAGGCSGPMLVLALDEAKETDEATKVDEFTILVDKELLKEADPITIDMNEMGFNISSSLPASSSCGCSSCGTGSCGTSGCC